MSASHRFHSIQNGSRSCVAGACCHCRTFDQPGKSDGAAAGWLDRRGLFGGGFGTAVMRSPSGKHHSHGPLVRRYDEATDLANFTGSATTTGAGTLRLYPSLPRTTTSVHRLELESRAGWLVLLRTCIWHWRRLCGHQAKGGGAGSREPCLTGHPCASKNRHLDPASRARAGAKQHQQLADARHKRDAR